MNSYALDHFIQDMEDLLEGTPAIPEIMDVGGRYVSKLLTNSTLLDELLSRLVLDDGFLKAQYQAIDPNDIIIYRSPRRSFSLRAFIWEPGVCYPIHDHGSWGVVGVYMNPIRERKYQRPDHGEKNSARVEVKSDQVLLPGQVTTVLPLDDGIHQMENPGEEAAISLHTYGAAIRKGYIQYFDPHFNTVRRVYPPTSYTRVLAIRTLGSMAQPWSKEVLKEAAAGDMPDYIKAECLEALQK